MQKYSKLLLMILIPLLIVLNGCWDRRELDTLAIVSGLAIDKADEPGKIQITAQIIKPGEMKVPQAGGGGGGEKPYWNITATGETVSETMREFTHESNRKLYLPHNETLIFSQDIAKEGIKKYVDFFVREPESTRGLTKVLVSKGKANDILDSQTELEKIPGENIAQLVDESVATSEESAVNLQEFFTRLMSKTTAPVASVIEVMDQGKEKIARLSGTAIFKTDKLVGYLNKAETRGLLWVIDKVKSGIIVVKSPSGEGKVSLEIIRASSEITTEIKDNKPYITINIDEEGNLSDQMSPDYDLTKLPVWSSLEKSQADAIQQEVMAALKKAQDLNTDIFGFGDAVHRKYPELWRDMEKQWDHYFPDLEVEVIINAKLSRPGMITKPPVQK